MWPISAVVVVLPFEPVMPQIGPLKKIAREFHFADDRNALRARRLDRRDVDRHARREHDQVGTA